MSQYSWDLREPPPASDLKKLGDLSPVVATILWHRGIRTAEEVGMFLEPDYSRHVHDPFAYTQMRRAVDRVIRAIKTGESIMIHGDYDADGATSTALLVESLRKLGAEVDWYVPDRFTEGYGLRPETIDRFIQRGVKILIAVDCGTSNVSEIAAAKSAGIETIILDHHQPAAERPPAIMLNPSMPEETYPFHGHSSAGVAFTFVRGMFLATENGATLGHPQPPGSEKWLLDLVAISTVADLMSLTGENRVFVKYGLMVLRKTRRLGLRVLLGRLGVSGDTITEQTIGFHVAPRINAAGRLKHASTAVRLLLTTDHMEAELLVSELEQINSDRQRLTSAATEEAWEMIQSISADVGAHAVYAPHWSPGVLGLVAGRIADKVWKPVIVMTDVDGHTVGSARSVVGINIMDIMNRGAKFFERYGGHPGASGFTLVDGRREEFQRWFQETIELVPDEARRRPLQIDAAAALPEVNQELMTALDTLAPFGVEHPRPVLILAGLICRQKSFAGADRQHLRLVAESGGRQASMIGFRLSSVSPLLEVGQPFDAVVEPSWNTWNGRTEVQLRIIDVRSTGSSEL